MNRPPIQLRVGPATVFERPDGSLNVFVLRGDGSVLAGTLSPADADDLASVLARARAIQRAGS